MASKGWTSPLPPPSFVGTVGGMNRPGWFSTVPTDDEGTTLSPPDEEEKPPVLDSKKTATVPNPGVSNDELKNNLKPSEIVQALDRHIVGQKDAKKAVAIAMRNRWRRRQLPDELRKEVTPRNVLLVGPTGTWKLLLFSSPLPQSIGRDIYSLSISVRRCSDTPLIAAKVIVGLYSILSSS